LKVGFVTISACFIIYCYLSIYRLVRSRGRRLSIHGAFTAGRLRRELTLLKTVLAVFLTFVANYMPITIVYGADSQRVLPFSVYFVVVLLLWTSPSVNWIVYGKMNDQYARAYKYVLCCGTGYLARRSTQLGWPIYFGPPGSTDGGVGSVASGHRQMSVVSGPGGRGAEWVGADRGEPFQMRRYTRSRLPNILPHSEELLSDKVSSA
jgi:hypothetical protein